MNLSEVIKKYRQENNLSMDELATRSGLSKPYISMLEKDKNSRNGKPIVPSLRTLQKLSKGMNVSLDSLLKLMDGNQEVSLPEYPSTALPPLTPKDEREIARDLEKMLAALDSKNSMAAMGGTVDDKEDQELLKASLLTSMRLAKQIAKKKFTPKKYRK